MVKTTKKTIINGKVVILDQNRPFASLGRLMRVLHSENDAFQESRNTQVRHGKNNSWPVPRGKGFRY